MSTAHAVMAATNLRSALDRYMEWRGIGESAVDLIPEAIRRPLPPDCHRIESVRFILPPGYREHMGMVYCHRDASGNALVFPPRLTLCTLAVRNIWSKP